MDISEAKEELRRGVKPSPDYPDLPNDFTADELIAFNPMAELEYRMAKDRSPQLTRAMLMQNWRSFRIGSLWVPEGKKGEGGQDGVKGFLRRAADVILRRH